MSLPTDNAARQRLQMFTYLTEYFPDAFLAELEVAVVGNEQHNPGEPLHWAREKSTDHMNKAFRHLFDYGTGVKKDADGTHHLAKVVWRLKAQLQLDLEAERTKKPVASPDLISCTSVSPLFKNRCELTPGHVGDHHGGHFVWHNSR